MKRRGRDDSKQKCGEELKPERKGGRRAETGMSQPTGGRKKKGSRNIEGKTLPLNQK